MADVSTFFNVEAAAAPDVESAAPASDLFDSFVDLGSLPGSNILGSPRPVWIRG